MATVVTLKPARAQEIVDATVVDGTVNGSGRLMLEYRDGVVLDSGPVKGPVGYQGPGYSLNGAQVTLYAGTGEPEGWLFCNGNAISRVNYPQLFAQIGTTFGAGDGQTTFNLPDFRGRVAVGLDPTQTEFNALAKLGGEKKHTLTANELPAHGHTVLGYAGVDDKNMTGNVGRMQAADTYGQNNTTYDKPTLGTGGGAAHNNLQPYNTVNYIIATGTIENGIALAEGGGIAAPRYYTSTERGSSVERDIKFGVPATLAERVALANQQVTWYNTTLGWYERYYEVSLTSGLNVIGLVVGATPGWYPISDGPLIELNALAQIDNFFDTFVTGWNMYNRKGGASWFTMNGTDRINVLKHGRYDLRAFTHQSGNTTYTSDFALQVLGTDNSTLVKNIGGGAFIKQVSWMTRPHQEACDVIILPNQKVGFKLQRGTHPAGDTTMAVHTGSPEVDRGRFSIKYVGPPLNEL